MSGYIAYVIPDITRDRLLADPVFFPKYPDVFQVFKDRLLSGRP